MKTLLDKFAMAALTGAINECGLSVDAVEHAYKIANAMMEERKKHVKEDDGWIAWEGGECPVDGGFYVDVKFKNGFIDGFYADWYDWSHDGGADDIIAYRIIK